MNIHEDVITENEEMEQTFLLKSLYLNGHFYGTKELLFHVRFIKSSGTSEQLRSQRADEMLNTLSLQSLAGLGERATYFWHISSFSSVKCC